MENGSQRISNFFGKSIVHVFLIIIAGFIAYSNTFRVPFIFDDLYFLVENPIIKDFRYFLEPSAANGYPFYDTFTSRYVGYLTFALNYRLHGLDVTGYHVINLAIHLANALLVYWLVCLTIKTPFFKATHDDGGPPDSYSYSRLIPLISALLFVVHPIQTQAVTYIYQRLASLVALFYLLSLVLYIKARLARAASTSCVVLYLLSFVSALLAMKTKENAFTLPVLMLLYEFMFLEGKWKQRIFCLLPFLLTMLIVPLSLIDIGKPAGELIGDVSQAGRMQTMMSRWDYLCTQFRVIITYLRLLFFPANQNIDYDYPIYHSLLNHDVLLSFVLLLSIFVLTIFLSYRSCRVNNKNPFLRLISFGICWFFIAISIESSIIPIKDVIFEHRIYLPSVGFFTAITTSLIVYYDKFISNKSGTILYASLFLATITLTFISYKRNEVWKSGISLWKDTIYKSPNLARPQIQLGQALITKGLWDEAESHFAKARELNQSPQLPNPHAAIGLTSLDKEGIINYQILQSKKDAAQNPNESTFIKLGRLYIDAEKLELAIEQFKKALQFNSKSIDAFVGLGIVYSKQDKTKEAVEAFNNAIDISPDSSIPHLSLGFIYATKLDRKDLAIKELQRAVAIDPTSLDGHKNLALAYSEQGYVDKAIYEYKKLLKLNARDDAAQFALGQLFVKKKQIDQAREAFNNALEINPNHFAAKRQLEAIDSIK
jgi:protein O-mannosyl-transferase